MYVFAEITFYIKHTPPLIKKQVYIHPVISKAPVMSTRHTYVMLISILLVALFTYAAVSKMIDYHNFTKLLSDSPLLSPIAGLLTWFIPAAELYSVILLLNSAWRKSGLLVAVILMTMFTGYITIMLVFFERIPCSCGGVFERLNWHEHLLFNLAFLLIAIIGFYLQHKDFRAKQENAENLKQSKHK
jgi:uncharacterized membrane protein YphA (DoxX/SURF4 family)